MSHPFEYRRPSENEAEKMVLVNAHIKGAYDTLLVCAAASAERTLAVRKLQEARMWANVAILGIELPR